MTRLLAYQHLEDAWAGGVADWCRAAAEFSLAGGRAWLLPAHQGQAQWIKARLLRAGVPLFGLRFLDARALRLELCQRAGLTPPAYGAETLAFLLRLRALAASALDAGSREPQAAAIARDPAGCLAMLADLDAAGWLAVGAGEGAGAGADASALAELLPAASLWQSWLDQRRREGAWTPELDRRLRRAGIASSSPPAPLSVCVLGWDAGCWPRLDLLLAAARAADAGAHLFLPQPRATADALEALQHGWVEAVAAGLGVEFDVCEPSPDAPAPPPLAALVERLEGSAFTDTAAMAASAADDTEPLLAAPEILVGQDWADQIALARDFIARWLVETQDDADARLAVLFPARGPSSAELVRALGRAGIACEDNLGERPEVSLPLQIQRAIIDYHLDEAGIEGLLTLVGLLNDHPDSFIARPVSFGLPLDPVALRRALADAFGELQHRNARLLTGGRAFGRGDLAGPLRRMVEHLGHWPNTLTWAGARRRWERTLDGFNLGTQSLEPLWSRVEPLLPPDEPVPARAFFEYLRSVVAAAGAPARRAAEGGRLFARVVVTSLAGATGQTWHSALFCDSNEGVWPAPRGENPFLDDRRRAQLNALRGEKAEGQQQQPEFSLSASSSIHADASSVPGHLLTSADRARLEQAAFHEVLEHCAGRVAFAATRREPAEPAKEAHPNEWSLRCRLETAPPAERAADRWLERWRASARCRAQPGGPKLPRAEAAHLREIFRRRRDPAAPFDEYLFDFSPLAPTSPELLALDAPWLARQLDKAWHCPATFALEQIFGVQPWRGAAGAGSLSRAEDGTIGRLVHRWVREALDGGAEPRPLTPTAVQQALTIGLRAAGAGEEAALRRALALSGGGDVADSRLPLPPWWRGVLAKAAWAARGCLEALAARLEAEPAAATARWWFCMARPLSAEMPTAAGPLRLAGRADLLLLDRPALAGAACQCIDIQTGYQSAADAGAPTLARMNAGHGLPLAAGLFLALAQGADPARSSAGILHPEGARWDALAGASAAPLATGALAELARRQRNLCFGQLGGLVAGHGAYSAENLPLATTPIAPAILEAKAAK